MKVVIAGGGKIGEILCHELFNEGYDIVLIENKERVLDKLINKYDITGLVGRAENYDDLSEAGVATADIFIAVTPEDEINMLACMIARKLGAKHTIARVRNPNYNKHLNFFAKELGLSMIVNPELAAANEMYNVLMYPESLSVESFAGAKVKIHELKIEKGSSLDGRSVNNFRSNFNDILICLVERNNQIIIPSGSTVLEANDRIYVTGHKQDLVDFMKKTGFIRNKIESVFIVGGGISIEYLLRKLNKLNIKVVELDRPRAKVLSKEFPNVHVIQADGTDQSLLKEERLRDFDAFIAYTGIDEENILTSMYAANQGIGKIITKVSRTDLLDIINDDKLQTIITSKILVIGKILKLVRGISYNKSSEVELIYRIADNKVEVSQFLVKDECAALNIPLSQLETKDTNLIAYIIRENKIFFPAGNDSIQLGDHVIIVSTEKITSIEDILR